MNGRSYIYNLVMTYKYSFANNFSLACIELSNSLGGSLARIYSNQFTGDNNSIIINTFKQKHVGNKRYKVKIDLAFIFFSTSF